MTHDERTYRIFVRGLKAAGLILLLAWLYVLSCGQISRAATYYISNGGDDGNNGTSTSTPWETVAHACSTITGGDSVLFMGGTYKENVWEDNIDPRGVTLPLLSDFNGSSSDPTVFKNAPGYGMPTISGYGTDGWNASCTTYAIADQGSIQWMVLDSLIIKYAKRGIFLKSGSNVTIQYCVACSTGEGVSGESNTGGLYVGTSTSQFDSLTVQYCTMFANWEEHNDSATINYAGMEFYATSYSHILHNTIYNEPRNGIWFKGHENHNNEIAYNTLIGNTSYNCGGVGIQILGCDTFAVHHNVAYGWDKGIVNYNYSAYPNESNYNIYYNNTVYGCIYMGMGYYLGSAQTGAEHCQWFNNIIIQNSGYDNLLKSASLTITNGDKYLDYNCYWNSGSSDIANWDGTDYTLTELIAGVNIDSHSVSVNPVFADTAGRDFTFTESSPASVTSGGIGGSYPTYMGAEAPTGGVASVKYLRGRNR